MLCNKEAANFIDEQHAALMPAWFPAAEALESTGAVSKSLHGLLMTSTLQRMSDLIQKIDLWIDQSAPNVMIQNVPLWGILIDTHHINKVHECQVTKCYAGWTDPHYMALQQGLQSWLVEVGRHARLKGRCG